MSDDRALRAEHRPTVEDVAAEGRRVYASVLRGLRSEDDSLQLRAIIASVEADASLYAPARPPIPAGSLDVERLSIAMNRAYVYGKGTAEQVAAEYARLMGDSDRG